MKIGIVDLGTLSLRFDVFKASPGSPPQLLHRYRSMPRLGEGAYGSGALSPVAAARVVEELEKVKTLSKEWQVDRLVAVGTGVLRTAAGGDELLSAIRARTGIALEVISGDREAELTARGILSNEEVTDGLIGLVDIGGGSTEVSFCRDRALQQVTSIDLGVAKLLQVAGTDRNHPYDTDTIERFRKASIEAVEQAGLTRHEAPELLFGSSGTIRALARLRCPEGEEHRVLSQKLLAMLLDEMVAAPREQALQIQGMEEQRIDLMVPGTILLLTVLRMLRAEQIHVTKFSLRHGLLAEALDERTR